MAFSFWWYPLTSPSHSWYTPTDLWRTYRDAQYVSWSGEGVIYNSGTFFESFPGIAVALAPIAWISGVLHLSESFPLAILRPSAWFLLGPANLLLGSFILFPLDALARRLKVNQSRRVVLTWLSAVLLWPVLVVWGHPEDLLAIAFTLYSLLAVEDGKWLRVGFFVGIAIAFQPLALIVLPISMSLIPARKWPPVLFEAALPSGILLVAPLVQQWGPTTTYLLKQPSFLGLDHATPWVSLAPVISPAKTVLSKVAESVRHANGTLTLREVTVRVHEIETIAAGPERLIVVALSCAAGVWVGYRRPALNQILWLAAVVLCLRCLFECVVDSYYLVPGLLLAIVVASTLTRWRFASTVTAAAITTWASYWFASPWHYYLAISTGLIAVLLLSSPFGNIAVPASPRAHEIRPSSDVARKRELASDPLSLVSEGPNAHESS